MKNRRLPPFGHELLSGKVYLVHAVNGAGKSAYCAGLIAGALSRGFDVATNLQFRRDSLTAQEDARLVLFDDYGTWARAYQEERKAGRNTAPMTLCLLDEAERFFGLGAEKRSENKGLEEIVMQTRSLGVSHVLAYPSVDGSGLSLLFRRRCAARIVPCWEAKPPLFDLIEAPPIAKVKKFPAEKGPAQQSEIWDPSHYFGHYRTDGGVVGDDYVVPSGAVEQNARMRRVQWGLSFFTIALGVVGWTWGIKWAFKTLSHPPSIGAFRPAPEDVLSADDVRALFAGEPLAGAVGVKDEREAWAVDVATSQTLRNGKVRWDVRFKDGTTAVATLGRLAALTETETQSLWAVSK